MAGSSAKVIEVDAARISSGGEPLSQIECFRNDRRVRGGVLTHVVKDRPLGA